MEYHPARVLFLVSLLAVGASPDVVICPPEDRALAPRIQGQLADLDANVAWPPACPSVTSPTVRVEGRPTQGYRILFEAPARTAKARRIEALESVSATREAAALAVRSVVKAVMMGIEPAWAEAPEAPDPDAGIAWRARAAAGMEVAGTGLADPALAAVVRGGLAADRMQLEIGGAFGVPRTLDDEVASIRLVEHAVFATVGYTVWADGPFEATGVLRGGVTFGRRSTTPVATDVQARPDDAPIGGFAGAALRGSVRIGGPVRLEAVVGADGVFGAPRLLYGRGDDTEVRASGWLIRPRGGLFVTIEAGGDSS